MKSVPDAATNREGSASRSSKPDDDRTSGLPDATASLQVDGIHIATFWKSPRNRREAIQVTLKEYEGHPYMDARVFTTNYAGQMVPTPRGIAIGIRTLPTFSKAVGDAVRKAVKMGLLTQVSS